MKYAWQELPPREAAEQAAGGDPNKLPWGFFSSDDLSIGGAGGFCWFTTAAELLAFVSEVILALPEPGDNQIDAEIKQCRESISNLEVPDLDLLDDINEILTSEEFGIEWWGNFEQLCQNEGDFEEVIRARFRDPDDEADEPNPTPISPTSRNKFAEFIIEYTVGG